MQNGVTPQTLLSLLAALGGLVAAVAFVYFWVRKGASAASDEALKNYRALSESRAEKIKELQSEVLSQAEEIKTKDAELRRAERDRNEMGQQNLRLYARMQKYERAINELRRLAGKPEIDFDDPQIHDTSHLAS
jgi:septal ring factor EnvC (AmiA/AmiB activator)